MEANGYVRKSPLQLSQLSPFSSIIVPCQKAAVAAALMLHEVHGSPAPLCLEALHLEVHP
jgi:hypothetical protein